MYKLFLYSMRLFRFYYINKYSFLFNYLFRIHDKPISELATYYIIYVRNDEEDQNMHIAYFSPDASALLLISGNSVCWCLVFLSVNIQFAQLLNWLIQTNAYHDAYHYAKCLHHQSVNLPFFVHYCCLYCYFFLVFDLKMMSCII